VQDEKRSSCTERLREPSLSTLSLLNSIHSGSDSWGLLFRDFRFRGYSSEDLGSEE